MEKNYLLTFMKDGKTDFNWFDSWVELKSFVDSGKTDRIFGAIKVNEFEEVDIEFN